MTKTRAGGLPARNTLRNATLSGRFGYAVKYYFTLQCGPYAGVFDWYSIAGGERGRKKNLFFSFFFFCVVRKGTFVPSRQSTHETCNYRPYNTITTFDSGWFPSHSPDRQKIPNLPTRRHDDATAVCGPTGQSVPFFLVVFLFSLRFNRWLRPRVH